MPTLLRGPLIGPMTEFVPHPMTETFRGLARRHAHRAGVLEPFVGGRIDRGWHRVRTFALARLKSSRRAALVPSSARDAAIESSLLAHIYACMATEAATNEIASEVIEYDKLVDFDRCKKQYAVGRAEGMSLLAWKWKVLLETRGHVVDIADPTLAELGLLVDDRNALIHYSLMDAATRLIFDRPRPTDATGLLVVWSARETPTRVEEGRFFRLMRADAAALAVKRMDDVLALWNQAQSAFRARAGST